MSQNRRKRRVYIDAGDGITIATSVRGALDPETEAAFIALARAAAARMAESPDATPASTSTAEPSPASDSPGSSGVCS